MHKLVVTLFILILFSCFQNEAHSFERDKYNRLVDSVAFKSKVSGTTWEYNWNGSKFIFGFKPDGKISKLKGWSKVQWTVNQRNEVVLNHGSKKMFLFFNDNGTFFKTVDWDGQRATGRRVFKDDI